MKRLVPPPAPANPYTRAKIALIGVTIFLVLALEAFLVWLTVAISIGFIPLPIIGGIIMLFFAAAGGMALYDHLDVQESNWTHNRIED